MKYTKLEIENFLEENMCYDNKGFFKLHRVIEIRVKIFKEALKISKIFGCFMNETLIKDKNDFYYFIYTKNNKKVLKLHKLKLKTLTLHSTKHNL